MEPDLQLAFDVGAITSAANSWTAWPSGARANLYQHPVHCRQGASGNVMTRNAGDEKFFFT